MDAGEIVAYSSSKGALAYTPLVDGEGYTFFLRGKTPTPEVVNVTHYRAAFKHGCRRLHQSLAASQHPSCPNELAAFAKQ